jgi:hypothetical protein
MARSKSCHLASHTPGTCSNDKRLVKIVCEDLVHEMVQDVMVVFVMMEDHKAVSRLASIGVNEILHPISANSRLESKDNRKCLPLTTKLGFNW